MFEWATINLYVKDDGSHTQKFVDNLTWWGMVKRMKILHSDNWWLMNTRGHVNVYYWYQSLYLTQITESQFWEIEKVITETKEKYAKFYFVDVVGTDYDKFADLKQRLDGECDDEIKKRIQEVLSETV